MTDRELMQQALEALDAYSWEQVQSATAALRERLAQPEQEPVAWMWKDGTITSDPDRADGTWTPLYTTPPRREWVGLTDEEKLHLEIMGGKSDVMLAEVIEDKLKEKNT